MAEYECSDIQEVCHVVDLNEKSDIRVSRLLDCETGEQKSVDIRQWFCTKKDPTKKPGKGIRVKDENMAELLWGILLSMSHESLMDFDVEHGTDLLSLVE